MPTNKDFKRLVRARMEKTGESYTTARSQLARSNVQGSKGPVLTVQQSDVQASIAAVAVRDLARLAGLSDASVKKATGCNWERWVAALDYAGADSWSHRSIADYVRYTYKTKDWWTQMVTVGYERIKGLREKGPRKHDGFEAQPRSGEYQATKSKTIGAPASRVYRAFTDARVRRRWLPGAKVTVRTSRPNHLVRMTWDDGTPIEVWLTSKGGGKTSAQVQHRKLADKTDADRRRAFWSRQLSALSEAIEG